ncbi:MAG: hypothetical protein ACMUIL_08365 [bacterium]
MIAVINAVAAALTLLFWTLAYIRFFAGAPIRDPVLRASAAATLGFLVGDLIWAVPVLILSVPGLWRCRDWGWSLAQAANVLWVYSLTAVWVRDLYAGRISPGAVLFTPFALVALWAIVYLWRTRDRFRKAIPDMITGDSSSPDDKDLVTNG